VQPLKFFQDDYGLKLDPEDEADLEDEGGSGSEEDGSGSEDEEDEGED
jgi:hypothetical protein